MNKDKSKSSKPNQKNKSQPRKNNILNNNTVNNIRNNNNNRNKNTYKNILSIKNINNKGLNRNIINDKISNKNIKIKKPINKLLTKFEEVKTDKLISIPKYLENKSMENKIILLKINIINLISSFFLLIIISCIENIRKYN